MTTNRPWADLPNARHIDAVLADVKTRPEVWKAAWIVARDAVRDATRDLAWVVAQGVARGGAWAAVWDAAWDAVQDTSRDAAWSAAWDTLRALLAWDSSAALLDLPPDALRTLMDVAAPPVCHQAALLLPWAIVRETP